MGMYNDNILAMIHWINADVGVYSSTKMRKLKKRFNISHHSFRMSA
jgi:hypothetical protein